LAEPETNAFGVRVGYRDNAKLFEDVLDGGIL
jgi:hypothetical protein